VKLDDIEDSSITICISCRPAISKKVDKENENGEQVTVDAFHSSITENDLTMLEPDTWLNDQVTCHTLKTKLDNNAATQWT